MKIKLLISLTLLHVACNASSDHKLRAYHHKDSSVVIAAELINLASPDQIASQDTIGLKIIACLVGNDEEMEKYQPNSICNPSDFDRELKPLHPKQVHESYEQYKTFNKAHALRTKNNPYEHLQDSNQIRYDDTSTVNNASWPGKTYWHAGIHKQTGKISNHGRVHDDPNYIFVKFLPEDLDDLRRRSSYRTTGVCYLTDDELTVTLKIFNQQK